MKVGIVGTSFVSDWFVEACNGIDELELVGVCSGHYENALKFQEKHHLEKAYKDYTSMLEDRDIEVVYIATPNAMHVSMAMDASSFGKKIILEKPIAHNKFMVENIFRMSNVMNSYVHDGIVPLYTKNFEILKNNIHRVGKIQRVVINFSKYSSRYDAYLRGENPPIFKKELNNGCWMDLGVYCVADCVALFGKPNDVYASSSFLETGVDCTSQAILNYDGFDAILMCSKVCDTQIISEIEGSDGTLQFVQPGLIEEVWFVDRKTKERTQLAKNEGNHFSEQLIDFVESIKEGRKESMKVPHSLSIDIIETLERCRKSSGILYKGESK